MHIRIYVSQHVLTLYASASASQVDFTAEFIASNFQKCVAACHTKLQHDYANTRIADGCESSASECDSALATLENELDCSTVVLTLCLHVFRFTQCLQ